jgi:Holliday junction resolvase RusA-like endonuclease
MIRLIIPGEAVAQGRPRFSTRSGFPRAYDPPRSRDYKAYVRYLAAEVAPETPIEGAVRLTVTVYRAIPKGFSKHKRRLALQGEILPVTKPDLDNVVKTLKDSLSRLIWRDDSQVVSLHATKFYSDNPRVEIEIFTPDDFCPENGANF